ncbi:MAG: UDP-N-acetylmuramate dehydrogenase [Deltaproteobacteria bacterium]|nr:UDP-N-acetylmuramate dehydrogenase [Deltaproteobacteria bacterium]
MAITAAVIAELRRQFGDQVRENVPLAPRTTMGVGGPARLYLVPRSREELERLHRRLRELGLPAFFLGGGANVIVADRGVSRQAVISLVEHLRGIEIVAETDRDFALVAEAGVRLSVLVAFCRRHGAGGLEFLAGIPGSVGGAVAMNAGAFGGEIGDRLHSVDLCRADEGLYTVERCRLPMAYRHGGLPAGAQVVAVRLRLEAREPAAVEARMAACREQRRRRQPVGQPTCGSVFKNPPGDYAGRLIEAAGCKGWRRGGARVAAAHANFIIAEPGATAADVFALMDMVREKVAVEFGVELQEEVVRLGE